MTAQPAGISSFTVGQIDGEVTVVPGVRMIPTPRHTPGHCSFLIESAAGSVVLPPSE